MSYNTPDEYLYNLEASTSSEAKRLWKNSIKDDWNRKCAYCNSETNLTIDHIIPQCKGGQDTRHNAVCACKKCNYSKGHTPWKDWYESQDFFTTEKLSAIIEWRKQTDDNEYYTYHPRRNII